MISVPVQVSNTAGIRTQHTHASSAEFAANAAAAPAIWLYSSKKLLNTMQDLLLEKVYYSVQIQEDISHSIFPSVIFSDLRNIRKSYTDRSIL